MRQALANGVMQRLGIRSTTRMNDEPMDSDIDSEIMPTTIAADYETLINECFQVLGLTAEVVRVSREWLERLP